MLEIKDRINLTLVIKSNIYYKMRYSIELRGRLYVKGYVFLSFAKNFSENVSNKYGEKLLDSAKKSTADAIKTASKRAIQKTVEATGDLIGNKIADEITSVSKSSEKDPTELHSKNDDDNSEIKAPKEGSVSPEEKWWIVDELRIIPKKDVYF